MMQDESCDMKVLALEAYYGGSHKAFIDGWIKHSRHDWTLLTLPANKWKWRMRHAAVTFADRVNKLTDQGRQWDIIVCSDMLNLAEFLGLTTGALQSLPGVVYFHENQLTYPVRFESERDYQFAVTNMTTALVATAVWFNSRFHRDQFLGALARFLKKMPDYQPTDAIERIRAKSAVHPPGINKPPNRMERMPGPIRILWAARWEHDKNPDDFFESLKRLKAEGIDFRISVIGPQFREVPRVFAWAKDFFTDHIDRWGYQKDPADYTAALVEADVIVSTANHEFFGLSIAEAIAAGAFPLLPRRLSYPELLEPVGSKRAGEFFYDGSVEDLARRLAHAAKLVQTSGLWPFDARHGSKAMMVFLWQNAAHVLDNALQHLLPSL
ncbi:MAG TPA: DUF3524 domain-containing protein [Planctomycetes bacterium]|nr:DUF3524 domain-containing protein [Planctomycetota bacterium]HIJ70428.1 DUF3524 domain-containing protein [Planctomycetota bacterium]